jgi:hypothetical protein
MDRSSRKFVFHKALKSASICCSVESLNGMKRPCDGWLGRTLIQYM